MEIEQRTPLITKKLLCIIKSIIFMMKKSLSKNIPWFELHMMLKRSTKIAGKAIGNLQLDHQTLSCRPNDIHSTFIAPIEYEFSCSNTPIFHPKRRNNRHHFPTSNGGLHRRSRKHRELTVNNVRNVFDFLNSSVEPEKSPLTALGFGGGANVRQLRVTDSPFTVSNTEEDGGQVDKMAEEFIRNFYEELKLERNRTAGEPPSPFCHRSGVKSGDLVVF